MSGVELLGNQLGSEPIKQEHDSRCESFSANSKGFSF